MTNVGLDCTRRIGPSGRRLPRQYLQRHINFSDEGIKPMLTTRKVRRSN
jgi:hypothetical protein